MNQYYLKEAYGISFLRQVIFVTLKGIPLYLLLLVILLVLVSFFSYLCNRCSDIRCFFLLSMLLLCSYYRYCNIILSYLMRDFRKFTPCRVFFLCQNFVCRLQVSHSVWRSFRNNFYFLSRWIVNHDK